ncbi:hypothetical protein BJV78DRAFT_1157686 [Lactifluus subvellereus]|nr:hypothetical protein BJV78DRAFT_1157686 [Lactifluus subvellereus]
MFFCHDPQWKLIHSVVQAAARRPQHNNPLLPPTHNLQAHVQFGLCSCLRRPAPDDSAGELSRPQWVLVVTGSWRIIAVHCMMEGEVYEILNNGKARNVPKCVDFCNVAHKDAYNLGRDISVGNILLTQDSEDCVSDGGGVLIDWGLCKVNNNDPPEEWQEPRSNHTGTWPMAAALVNDPTVQQTTIYDLESTYYVLVWQSVRYLASSWDIDRLSKLPQYIPQGQCLREVG